MTPSTSNPFHAIEQAFERMTRRFDEAARSWERGETPELWSATLGGAMACDVIERDDTYDIEIDVPGFENDDIEVRVTDHTLHVAAERSEERDVEDAAFVRRERQHRSLERSIQLPENIDADDIEARTTNGVLTITVPKLEEEMGGRTIEVEAA